VGLFSVINTIHRKGAIPDYTDIKKEERSDQIKTNIQDAFTTTISVSNGELRYLGRNGKIARRNDRRQTQGASQGFVGTQREKERQQQQRRHEEQKNKRWPIAPLPRDGPREPRPSKRDVEWPMTANHRRWKSKRRFIASPESRPIAKRAEQKKSNGRLPPNSSLRSSKKDRANKTNNSNANGAVSTDLTGVLTGKQPRVSQIKAAIRGMEDSGCPVPPGYVLMMQFVPAAKQTPGKGRGSGKQTNNNNNNNIATPSPGKGRGRQANNNNNSSSKKSGGGRGGKK